MSHHRICAQAPRIVHCALRNHEWEETSVGHSASILSANVDEDGASAVPVLLTCPETLLVQTCVQEIEMVNFLSEFLLFELREVNLRPSVIGC